MADNRQKRRRIVRLAEEQGWRCWICGHRMRPPAGPGQDASRIDATLDHLEPKPPRVLGLRLISRERPAKAAHRWCNSARKHDPGLAPKDQARMDALFSNAAWVAAAFPGERKEEAGGGA